MGAVTEGTKAYLRFLLMYSAHIWGIICTTMVLCYSCSVGRHTCLAAGTAGKLRLELFPFKANGILDPDFRWSRIST